MKHIKTKNVFFQDIFSGETETITFELLDDKQEIDKDDILIINDSGYQPELPIKVDSNTDRFIVITGIKDISTKDREITIVYTAGAVMFLDEKPETKDDLLKKII